MKSNPMPTPRPSLALLPLLALVFCVMLSATGTASAATLGGIELDEEVSVDDTTLALNGAGLRKKFFITLYVGSLYLDSALTDADADAIVQADAPMMIQLDILSNLLTREKLIEALDEGFRNSTNNNTASIGAYIAQMKAALDQPVSPGDQYRIVYSPDTGTQLERSGELLVTIPGIAFKRAAFGIWLSQKPAQASLKNAMLGR